MCMFLHMALYGSRDLNSVSQSYIARALHTGPLPNPGGISSKVTLVMYHQHAYLTHTLNSAVEYSREDSLNYG